jgi:hypothetical protein
MSQANPVYGNQFFTKVENFPGSVQRVQADNITTTHLHASTSLRIPVQNTGPTGPAVAGQITLLNYPAGTYSLLAFNGTSWVPL